MDVQPPSAHEFRASRGLVDEMAELRLVRYHAFLGEATILLPLSTAFLGAVLLLLGPYLLGKVGVTSAAGGVSGLFLYAGAHRMLVGCGLVAAVVLVLASLRSVGLRELFCRSNLAPSVGKLVLFLPLVAGVALLLLSILTPLMTALSTTP